MRILLVDNHDSYTYNLFQLFAAAGHPPHVVTNDAPAWDRLDVSAYDAAVISPGPGRPQHPGDVGHAPAVLAEPGLPVLGVCLGHQLIAHQAGAAVRPAPAPRHGHLTRVTHTATGLFAGLPQDFTAVRYHSLAVADPPAPALRPVAWAEDGVIMALHHTRHPHWGVQFHPESIASEHGHRLVANFLSLAGARPRAVLGTPPAAAPAPSAAAPGDHRAEVGGDALHWRVLDTEVDTAAAHAALPSAAGHAFWLDSSRPDDTARFSFLGAPGGPRAEVLRYHVAAGHVAVHGDVAGATREPGTIFDVLRRRTAPRPAPPPDGLPFDFTGGYVGYFGYELKADCGATARHRSDLPDAVWLRVDRFVAVDHHTGRTYLVARAPRGDEDGARRWIAATHRRLADLPQPPAPTSAPPPAGADPRPWVRTPRPDYLAAVKTCLDHLAAGESYELCLTTQARLPLDTAGAEVYRRLRRAEPAPYGALLRLGETSVLSASPERFLRIDGRGVAESRPIKGTAARLEDPAADAAAAAELRRSAKTRAENLMIVDLLRNDLGRVCQVGSVTVPQFMYTRSYATVHQLISTVCGVLDPAVHPVTAIQACFPGGSMTGAPKLRSMQLLDELETQARGVYSGALGYVGYEGTADLSIVIRTAVHHGGQLRVGAGGAIVLDSDPDAEYEEMLLKAAVPLRALV